MRNTNTIQSLGVWRTHAIALARIQVFRSSVCAPQHTVLREFWLVANTKKHFKFLVCQHRANDIVENIAFVRFQWTFFDFIRQISDPFAKLKCALETWYQSRASAIYMYRMYKHSLPCNVMHIQAINASQRNDYRSYKCEFSGNMKQQIFRTECIRTFDVHWQQPYESNWKYFNANGFFSLSLKNSNLVGLANFLHDMPVCAAYMASILFHQFGFPLRFQYRTELSKSLTDWQKELNNRFPAKDNSLCHWHFSARFTFRSVFQLLNSLTISTKRIDRPKGVFSWDLNQDNKCITPIWQRQRNRSIQIVSSNLHSIIPSTHTHKVDWTFLY